jgi:hypothetical protein
MEDWKSYIVLACIACKKVILLEIEDNYLQIKGYDNQTVGIHALINGHEYHCVAIRMRCWLMDVLILRSGSGLKR